MFRKKLESPSGNGGAFGCRADVQQRPEMNQFLTGNS
jgi:hypothetical protein